MIRKVAHVLSLPLIWILMYFKIAAYQTRFSLLRHIILEVTSFFDFLMVFLNIQNHAMSLHHWVFGGNFIFGKAVMVVDYETALREIPCTSMRGSRFMGIPIVSNDPGVFATNAGPLTTSQPARQIIRKHMEENVVSSAIRHPDYQLMRSECSTILREWAEDRRMATMWSIRGAATRIMVQLVAKKDVSREQANRVTRVYFRRFGEFTLFGYYMSPLLGILGTREAIRRDAYVPLQNAGVDNLIIDMTLFAAMFSLGTIVMKCIEYTKTYNIDYATLIHAQRVRFVIESQRLYPTVTSVHRILDREELVEIRGNRLRLHPGDEIAYPFVCINRDPRQFTNPNEFRLDRSEEEVGRVLSWSTGPHACPVKDLSILVTVLMLDALSERHDLRKLRFFNIEV